MPDQLTFNQFAGVLRESSPGQYDEIADDVLVKMFISSYPEYQDVLLEDEAQKLTRERVQLNPIQEKEFQQFWTKDPSVQNWKKELGDENKSPDDYRDKFDYREAWASGDAPEYVEEYGEYHWGSSGKDEDHPSYWMQYGLEPVPERPELERKSPARRALELGYRPEFGEILSNQADLMWKETVAGLVGMSSTAVQGVLTGSGTDAGKDWGREVVNWAEDWRKDVDKYTYEKIQEDPTLKAFYEWKKYEPISTSNLWHFDLMKRGAAEAIPSLALAVAGTATGYAMSLAGMPGWAVTSASLAPMFMAEAGSEYNEAMRILVDEKGLDPIEANDYASLLAAGYGTVSSLMERAGLRYLGQGIPGLKNIIMKDTKKSVLSRMADDMLVKGLNMSGIKRVGLKGIAGTAKLTSSVLGEGGTEYLQAWTQNTINYGLREGWGKSAEDVMQVVFEGAKESALAGETFDEAYAGGVMGLAFGGVAGVSTLGAKSYKRSAEEWEAMSYREVQNLAKRRGVSAKGKRIDIISRIAEVESGGVQEEAPLADKKPEPSIGEQVTDEEVSAVEDDINTKDYEKKLVSNYLSNLADPKSKPVVVSKEEADANPVAALVAAGKKWSSQGLKILDLVAGKKGILKEINNLAKEQKESIYNFVKVEMQKQYPNSTKEITDADVAKFLKIHESKGRIVESEKEGILDRDMPEWVVDFDEDALTKGQEEFLIDLGVPVDIAEEAVDASKIVFGQEDVGQQVEPTAEELEQTLGEQEQEQEQDLGEVASIGKPEKSKVVVEKKKVAKKKVKQKSWEEKLEALAEEDEPKVEEKKVESGRVESDIQKENELHLEPLPNESEYETNVRLATQLKKFYERANYSGGKLWAEKISKLEDRLEGTGVIFQRLDSEFYPIDVRMPPEPIQEELLPPLAKFEKSAMVAESRGEIVLEKIKGKWKAKINGKEVSLTKEELKEAKKIEGGAYTHSQATHQMAGENLRTAIYQRAVIDAKKKAEESLKNLEKKTKGKPSEGTDDLRENWQAGSLLPRITDAKEASKKIVASLKKTYPFIKVLPTVEKLVDSEGVEKIGRALGTVVEWSRKGRIDTPPHEFAHVYVGLLADDPLVKRGLKLFKGEENLVTAIGEYYTDRILNTKLKKKLGIWLRNFWARVKMRFRGTEALSKEQVFSLVAEGFVAGKAPTTRVSMNVAYAQKPHLARELKYMDDKTIDTEETPDEVSGNDFSTSNINHLNSFFTNIWGHIKKEKWSDIQKVGSTFDTFDEFIEWVRPYAVANFNVDSDYEYNKAEINNLKQLWQKLKSRIPLFTETEKKKKPDKRAERYRRRVKLYFKRVWNAQARIWEYHKPLVTYVHNGMNEAFGKSVPFFEPMNFIEEQQAGEGRVRTIYLSQNDILSWNTNMRFDAEAAVLAEQEGRPYNQKPKFYEKMDANFGDWIKHIENVFRTDASQGAPLMFFAGAKGGDNKSMFIGIVEDSIVQSVTDQASFVDYFSKDIRRIAKEAGIPKDKIEKIVDDMVREAVAWGSSDVTPLSSLKWAQIAGYHEWWKGVRFDGYFLPNDAGQYPSLGDLWRRLNIDFHDGTVARGSGSSKIMVVDPSDPNFSIEMNGEKVDHMYKNRYAFDGWLITSGRRLAKLANALGREPSHSGNFLHEVKSFIRWKDGNDYIGLKHLEMEAETGMVFKMGDEVIAEVKYDRTGATYFTNGKRGKAKVEFDMIASTEEAKVTNGKFSELGVIHELPEEATKIKFTTNERTKGQTAYPFAQAQMFADEELLVHKEFKDAYKAVVRHIRATTRQWLSGDENHVGLLDMRQNYRALKDMLYSKAGSGQLMTEQQKLLELISSNDPTIDGLGVHHPEIIRPLKNFIFNKFIRFGLFKGRQRGKNQSTLVYTKPKASLAVKAGEFSISRKNHLIWNKVRENYITWFMEQDTDEVWTRTSVGEAFSTMSKVDQLRSLNIYLSDNPLYFQVSRQPVAKVTGVKMYRLKMIKDGRSSDVAYMHPADVFDVIDGDHDGDKVAIEYFDDPKVREPLIKLTKSKIFKEISRIVDLDIFEKGQKQGIFQKDGIVKGMKGTVSASGAPGQVTSAKGVASILAYKNVKIRTRKMGSNWIHPRKTGDSITLDFMPLDKQMLLTEREKGKTYYDFIIESGDSVVNSKGEAVSAENISGKGNLYLKTNFGHFTSILLQAAVDDATYGLLSKMQYKGFPWLARRIFVNTDKSDLTNGQVDVIRKIFKYFNFFRMRQGKLQQTWDTTDRQRDDNQDLGTLFKLAERIRNFEESSTEEKAKELGQGRIINPGMKKEEQLVRVDVDNEKLTPIEEMFVEIANIMEEFNNKLDDGQILIGDSFLEWQDAAMETIHQHVIMGMEDIWSKTNHTKDDLLNGVDYMDRLSKDYFKLIKEIVESRKDPNVLVQYDTSEAFQDMIDKYIDEFNGMEEGAQVYSTLYWLRGVKQEGMPYKSKILRLLPIDLMNKNTVYRYLRRLEIMMQEPQEILNKMESAHSSDFGTASNKVFGFNEANNILTEKQKDKCG